MLCYSKSLQSCPTLCDPRDGSPLASHKSKNYTLQTSLWNKKMVKFSKCIHIIHYAGSTKKKKYLIIFIDVKKAFDKMSHQFLTKFSLIFFFWLPRVFVATRGFFQVAARGSYSLVLQCSGFSLQWFLLLWRMGSRDVAAWAPEHGLSSCGTQS